MKKTAKTLIITGIVVVCFIAVCVLLSMREVESFQDKYAGADLLHDVEGLEREGTYDGYLDAHADAASPSADVDVDIYIEGVHAE